MRLAPQILSALEETGMSWAVENGRKHHKLRVGGRLAAILPHGGCHEADRAVRNTVAQIRRVAREVLS